MRIVTKILLTALTLLVVAEYIPGIIIEGVYPAIVAAISIGILNFLVRPILLIVTLPITILTLGLFILIINASLFWFAASFIDGFTVSSFWYALLGSLIVSLTSTISNRYIK
jgi:putative membrane protein